MHIISATLALKCDVGIVLDKIVTNSEKPRYVLAVDAIRHENYEVIDESNVKLFRLFAIKLLEVCDEIQKDSENAN